MSQDKMLRLLRLLMLLNSTRKYSLNELKEKTGMSDSTLYRYFDTFETAGFLLNRDKGRYNLKAEEKNVKSLNSLFHFSEEEAFILHQTISLLDNNSLIKEKLIKKLHTLYDFKAIAATHHDEKIKIISIINKAIEEKKQLQIDSYRSSNSSTVLNRLVEPFSFINDYSATWCYDLDDNKCKLFKLARMGSVHITSNRWANEDSHKISFSDAFRLSAPAPIDTITIIVTLKAYNLLTEEFPLTQPYLSKYGKNYQLTIPVASYAGIGRFVLGLWEEILIIKSRKFLSYLKKKRELLTDFH